MSKRGRSRKGKEAASESGKTGGKTRGREAANEDEYRLIGVKKAFFYSIVIAVLFFGIGFLVNPAVTGQIGVQPVEGGNDMFIFISPPGCTNCAELEPIARDVADTLGIAFIKTGYVQEIPNPGLVLIYKDVLTISGMEDEYTLKAQVCALTDNQEICNRASELEPETTVPEVPKSDRPEAHAFVMSYCPYGLQFMKAYVPVIELLGDKADIELNFVHYLMHGEEERDENTRMYCIQKEQKDKFTDYLRCFVEEGDYEGCISEVGIDSGKLDVCMQETDEEFEITKSFEESEGSYPPYLVDAALAQIYGVQGSPTFGINGQQVQVSRSPEAIKQAICSAFNSPPAECSQALSSASETAGFGPIGSGGGSETQAQC